MRTVCVETFIIDTFLVKNTHLKWFFTFVLLLLLLLLFYCDFITNVINKSVSIYYKKFSLSLEKLNHD